MLITRVKICGIKSATAFDAVVAAGADFVGFNFFAASPRFVTPGEVASLSARHSGGPLRVGLFVSPGDDEIRAVLAGAKMDILQIYADAARCRAIKKAFGLPVWRAVGVEKMADLPVTAEGLDGFVIESRAPAGATRPGGNGAVLDVSVLAGWVAPGFWLLGGGLRPDNVAAAIGQTGAPGVDVSSGVESALGEKSPALIAEFVAIARSASRPVG